MRQERFQRETDIIESLGIADSYNATFEALSGVTFRRCVDGVRGVPARHAGDVGRRVRRGGARELGIDPRRRRAPTRSRFARAASSTPYFPASDMEREVRRQVREMGVDPRPRTGA